MATKSGIMLPSVLSEFHDFSDQPNNLGREKSHRNHRSGLIKVSLTLLKNTFFLSEMFKLGLHRVAVWPSSRVPSTRPVATQPSTECRVIVN